MFLPTLSSQFLLNLVSLAPRFSQVKLKSVWMAHIFFNCKGEVDDSQPICDRHAVDAGVWWNWQMCFF